MAEKLEYRLMKGGYLNMSSGEQFEAYRVFCEFLPNIVNVVVCIDAIRYEQETMRSFKEKIVGNLDRLGKSAHFLTILCIDEMSPDYIEQMTVARQVCVDDSFAWIYEETTDKLIIYDTQVEEFYGLKRLIESDITAEELRPVRTETVIPRKNPKELILEYLKNLPKAVTFIVIANILVFIVCTFTGDLLYNKGAVGLTLVKDPSQWYRIFSSMFLHADAGHIFNNMLLLFFAGEMAERALGTVSFSLMYLISGIGGCLLTFASEVVTGEPVLIIGASGAVFGVLGTLVALVLFKRIRGETLKLPRMIIMLGLSIYSGFRATNVANWAHIGGVLTGFAFGIIYCLIKRYSRR
ncbi:MAG: rhomboid family intramembrane serine protease [Lachnospiraceae bacterium]|nr:rhomboid family intramembrane serine protease [Lachnospiraceae bacterium]